MPQTDPPVYVRLISDTALSSGEAEHTDGPFAWVEVEGETLTGFRPDAAAVEVLAARTSLGDWRHPDGRVFNRFLVLGSDY